MYICITCRSEDLIICGWAERGVYVKYSCSGIELLTNGRQSKAASMHSHSAPRDPAVGCMAGTQQWDVWYEPSSRMYGRGTQQWDLWLGPLRDSLNPGTR